MRDPNHQKRQRHKIDVELNGDKMLKINGNELLKINKSLGNVLKINKESVLKINGMMLRINIELLKINAKTVENQHEASKINITNEADNSRFSADFGGQKNAFSPASRALGGGGVDLNEYNSNVTNRNSVTSKDNLNLKSLKENVENQQMLKISKREKWEKIEAEFLKYLCLYPKEGRVNFRDSKIAFNKVRSSIPEVYQFYGMIKHFRDRVWFYGEAKQTRIPPMLEFFNGDNWKLLDAAVKREIEKYKMPYAKQAEKIHNVFLGKEESK
jgi:hypothetical protein